MSAFAVPLTLGVLILSFCTNQSIAQVTDSGPELITGQARQPTERALRKAPGESLGQHSGPILDALKPLPSEHYPRRKSKRQARHRLDQDRDGYVSKNEFELEHQTKAAAFRAADANRDG